MKKLHLMIVPLLLTALSTSAQESTVKEFGAFFGTSVDILENTQDQKNVSLAVQAMIFPDLQGTKQFSLYYGGGGAVANTNGVTDTAQTIFGEIGLKTKYVTPFVSVYYARETSGYREDGTTESDPVDEELLELCELNPDECEGVGQTEPTDLVDLFYGSGVNFGVGVIVNDPITDTFSAKISSVVGDDLALDIRLYYQAPIAGQAKPVFSIGYKKVIAENEIGAGQRDGDGVSVTIGISRRL
ncbi:MAG: hypothetical protein F4Z01_09325 [Gammaproteobacteria bacterium]|nr:hypothetical protein [Gammaproteobacteria bacterium]MYF37552.1 hypothetical protein [Gammaproteobacteria bacterium]